MLCLIFHRDKLWALAERIILVIKNSWEIK